MKFLSSILLASVQADFNPECPTQKPADECAIDCSSALLECNQVCAKRKYSELTKLSLVIMTHCVCRIATESMQSAVIHVPVTPSAFMAVHVITWSVTGMKKITKERDLNLYSGPRSGPIFLHVQSPDQKRTMRWYRDQYDEEVGFATSVTEFNSKSYRTIGLRQIFDTLSIYI